MSEFETKDLDIAKLYRGVKDIDAKLIELDKASFFDKAKEAEKVIKDTRDLMLGIVSTMHKMNNDINRLKANENGFAGLPL